MTPAPQTLDSIRAVLERAEWRFAKTMPENPHWYTLRKAWTDDGAFVEAVEFIRRHGVVERYPDPEKGRKYIVLILGEHKYWTMGWPVEKTILINRKPVT